MRLGGPVFLDSQDPTQLVKEHIRLGYRAAYCPSYLSMEDLGEVRKAEEAFAKQDVVIAEVGAWCNPLDPNPEKANKAREYIKTRLALADEIGARNCVNILGSFNPNRWDGVHPLAYSDTFFEASVECYRDILNAVNPKRTYMTFETMPYYILDCPEEYIRLLKAIDHPRAATHLDACNCVNSPKLLYNTKELVERSFALLGATMRSCHLKDITLEDVGCTALFREVQPGSGNFNLRALLSFAHAHPDRDLPVMIEHLPDEAAYTNAKDHVLGLMQELRIT